MSVFRHQIPDEKNALTCCAFSDNWFLMKKTRWKSVLGCQISDKLAQRWFSNIVFLIKTTRWPEITFLIMNFRWKNMFVWYQFSDVGFLMKKKMLGWRRCSDVRFTMKKTHRLNVDFPMADFQLKKHVVLLSVFWCWISDEINALAQDQFSEVEKSGKKIH